MVNYNLECFPLMVKSLGLNLLCGLASKYEWLTEGDKHKIVTMQNVTLLKIFKYHPSFLCAKRRTYNL
jgi:hypothetical protein